MKNLIKLGIDLVIRVIPIIGDAKENRDSRDGGKGRFQWGKFAIQVLRTAGTIGAALLMR